MTTPLRGIVAAALVASGPLAVLGQTTPTAPARNAPAPSAAPAPYKSAFEGYHRFDDQKVRSWREANDEVGRIGGWQAYAREAAGEAAPAAAAASMPAQAASRPHDAHPGQGGHSMHKKP